MRAASPKAPQVACRGDRSQWRAVSNVARLGAPDSRVSAHPHAKNPQTLGYQLLAGAAPTVRVLELLCRHQ
jgi:hypothetical protein